MASGSSSLVCEGCGQPVQAGDRFCRNCGRPQARPPRRTSASAAFVRYLQQARRIADGESDSKPEPPKSVRFDDVAGLGDLKQTLREIAMVAQGRGPKGLRPWRAVMLFGPPGTGKTLIARALAGELGWYFRAASGSDFKSKWYGESEQNIHNLFEDARQQAPSVVFWDEVDNVSGQRTGNAGDSVLTQLLQEIEGFTVSSSPVLLMAATNLPWALDEAFVSRMERRILVPLPEAAGREEILRLYTREFPLEDGMDFADLAQRSEWRSGRELERICQDAAIEVWRESAYDPERVRPVGARDFHQAIDRNPPLTTRDLVRTHEQWAERYGTDGRKPADDGAGPVRRMAAPPSAAGLSAVGSSGGTLAEWTVPAGVLRELVVSSFDQALECTAGLLAGAEGTVRQFVPAARLAKAPSDSRGIALIQYLAGQPLMDRFTLPFDLWQLPEDLVREGQVFLQMLCVPGVFCQDEVPRELTRGPREQWQLTDQDVWMALFDCPLSGKSVRPRLQRHREWLQRVLPQLAGQEQAEIREMLERLDRVLAQLLDGSLSPLVCVAFLLGSAGPLSWRIGPVGTSRTRVPGRPLSAAPLARALAGGDWAARWWRQDPVALHGFVTAVARAADRRPAPAPPPEREVPFRPPAAAPPPPASSKPEGLDERIRSLESRLQQRLNRLSGQAASTGPQPAGPADSRFERPALISGFPPRERMASQAAGLSGLSTAPAFRPLAGSGQDIELSLFPAEWTGLVRAYRQQPELPQVSLRTSGIHRLEDLHLRLEMADFSHPHEELIPRLDRQTPVTLTDVALPPKLAAYRQVSERVRGRLTATLTDATGRLLQVARAEIPVLAYNECPISAEEGELIACFVQPNDPGVIEVTKLAAAHARQLNGSAALCGYQQPDPQFIDNMVQAVYLAVQKDLQVTYINPPPSFEGRRMLQRLRTPGQIVLRERQATCFDLALLFAACLEHIGLNPLVFLIRGHAFFGYFVSESNYPLAVTDRWPQIDESLRRGQLVAINSTSFCEGCDYAQSREHGERCLADESQFEFAIDVVQARRRQLLPLPFES